MSLHLILLLLLPILAAARSPIGITANLNYYEISKDCNIVDHLRRYGTARVRLIDPLREHISMFRGSGFTLSLALAHSIVIDNLAQDVTSARSWLLGLGLLELDGVTITDISIGYNMTSEIEVSSDWMGDGGALEGKANKTMRAMASARKALDELGLNDIRITTELSFSGIITGAFPPTKAEFRREMEADIKKLLWLLREWRSPFQIDIQPYELVLVGGCGAKFALFEIDAESELARIDQSTGYRYGNIFEEMVDAVLVSLAKIEFGDMEVQVVSTGWPTHSAYYDTTATTLHAAEYLGRLSSWMASGSFGTPLRPTAVPFTYVHSLLDDNVNSIEDGHKNAMGVFEYDSRNLCVRPRFYLSLNGTYEWN